MVVRFIVLLLLLASMASAETELLLDNVRLEPATICAGESTVLFFDIDNQGTVPRRDALLRISSPFLELGFGERIDVSLGRTTRLMQFSVPSDARGDYVVTVELDTEKRSVMLRVLSCTSDTRAPLLMIPAQQKSSTTHYAAIAGVVGLQLLVVLAVVFVVFMIVQARKEKSREIVEVTTHQPLKRKRSKKSKAD